MLPLEATPGSAALQQQGSVITRGQVDTPGPGCCPGIILLSEGYADLDIPLPGHCGKTDPTLASCSIQESSCAHLLGSTVEQATGGDEHGRAGPVPYLLKHSGG